MHEKMIMAGRLGLIDPPKSGVKMMLKLKKSAERQLRLLPVVQFREKEYFVDESQREFREVDNPDNYVCFGSEQGQQMIEKCERMKCREYKLDRNV